MIGRGWSLRQVNVDDGLGLRLEFDSLELRLLLDFQVFRYPKTRGPENVNREYSLNYWSLKVLRLLSKVTTTASSQRCRKVLRFPRTRSVL